MRTVHEAQRRPGGSLSLAIRPTRAIFDRQSRYCRKLRQEFEATPVPTDLEAVIARKRQAQREREKDNQDNTTMLSVWMIVCLVMLVLVFVDKSYAQALQSFAPPLGELFDDHRCGPCSQ